MKRSEGVILVRYLTVNLWTILIFRKLPLQQSISADILFDTFKVVQRKLFPDEVFLEIIPSSLAYF